MSEDDKGEKERERVFHCTMTLIDVEEELGRVLDNLPPGNPYDPVRDHLSRSSEELNAALLLLKSHFDEG